MKPSNSRRQAILKTVAFMATPWLNPTGILALGDTSDSRETENLLPEPARREPLKGSIEITASCDSSGTLNKSLNFRAVANEVLSTYGFCVGPNEILIDEPIDSVGLFKIRFKNNQEECVVRLWVLPDPDSMNVD